MPGDSLGVSFKIHSFGESHGSAIGVSVEGCPSLLEISEAEIQEELDRRRPGQNKFTTQRKEPDTVEILSGVHGGKTLGSPILLLIKNQDQKSKDYENIKDLYRPSHSDYTYEKKYGIRFVEGGGRSSARITAGWVAGGAIAKKILQKDFNIEILAYVKQIGNLSTQINLEGLTKENIEKSPIRCPDEKISQKMEDLILDVKKLGDSLGGIIECYVKGVPAGWGEPVFDKIESDLAKAMLAIPATKGFEIGEGFNSVNYRGSTHNDIFICKNGEIKTKTNHSGGVQGGITNGMPLIFRVAFKPTATIYQSQSTINKKGEEVSFQAEGRHDPCVLPRAVPIVEALCAIVLCDHYLRFQEKPHFTN